MEIFELKYFLGVAQFENIHRASEKLRVSPASLSKAISRIEEELGVSLFSREGRNIRITDPGRLLQMRASQIVQLEEATRVEISGHEGTLHVVMAGAEVLLSSQGLGIAKALKLKHPRSVFEFQATITDETALEKVAQGEAHLALVTSDVPPGLTSKVIVETKFQTVVGGPHPLHAQAKAKKGVPVEEVLKHAFASPAHALLGRVGQKQSVDGWRDDQFPRKVEYLTSSLSLLVGLVESGLALAYLPDHLVKCTSTSVLKVMGCPYSCSQKIRLVAREPKNLGWLNQIF